MTLVSAQACAWAKLLNSSVRLQMPSCSSSAGLDASQVLAIFDQHALAGNAGAFVATDEAAGLFDGPADVEGVAGIHFGGHDAGDRLQDFDTESDSNRPTAAVRRSAARNAERFVRARAQMIGWYSSWLAAFRIREGWWWHPPVSRRMLAMSPVSATMVLSC